MLRKQNKTLTVFFSLLPGAGHMFMGFMKRGLSLMSLFFLTIFLSSWLGIGPLLYVLPVLWFYAFFDSINIAWTDDSEFSKLEDRYLFKSESFARLNERFSGRCNLYFGILLVFFGAYLILSKMISRLYPLLRPEIADLLSNLVSVFPQFFLGVIIIWIGIRLIAGKKKELEKHD
jgi:hypothetical protein